MKRVVLLSGVLIVAGAALGQSVAINSFDQNGSIAWTAPSGSVCTVEWASSLVPTPNWSHSWHSLTSIPVTNSGDSANVPMFYRVTCWTNGLFLSMPPGRTYVYSVSNAIGEIGEVEVRCIGFVSGPLFTNGAYVLVADNAVDSGVTGAEGIWAGIFRSTDSVTYMHLTDGPAAPIDHIQWQAAPSGTTWTNVEDESELRSVVANNVSVSVPAGTFTNCVVVRHFDRDNPTPFASDIYWSIQPGFALVKFEDYWTDADPVVFELKSWRDD